MTAEVTAWRVFGLHGDRLLAPFRARYWEHDRREAVWGSGIARAQCLAVAGHRPPEDDCTCGIFGTTDLQELLGAVVIRRFEGSSRSVLDDCGVLARVLLRGHILEGPNIGPDDPPTTVRASSAYILDLHLSEESEDVARDLQRHYEVPVVLYDRHEWPHRVAEPKVPEPTVAEIARFRAAVGGLSFGVARQLSAVPGAMEAMTEVALDAAASIRNGGVKWGDHRKALFDSSLEPDLAEVDAFLTVVHDVFLPDVPLYLDRADFGAVNSLHAGMRRVVHVAESTRPRTRFTFGEAS